MKGKFLHYALMAIVAAVVIPGYGDDKVDYAQMELLVTSLSPIPRRTCRSEFAGCCYRAVAPSIVFSRRSMGSALV